MKRASGPGNPVASPQQVGTLTYSVTLCFPAEQSLVAQPYAARRYLRVNPSYSAGIGSLNVVTATDVLNFTLCVRAKTAGHRSSASRPTSSSFP